MHELALARSICRIGLRAGGGRRVVRVNVDVGQLRQVVAPTLVACWGFVTANTLLAEAELVVHSIPAVITCQKCGARTELTQPFLICGNCGSQEVEVVSGREFLLRSLDLADKEA